MPRPTRVTPKIKVAKELLEAGLQSYFKCQYFAALHLAGGADDIFGGYVARGGTESAFESMKTGALRIAAHLDGTQGFDKGPPATEHGIAHVLNYARNRTKHLNGEGDDDILFDPKHEAGNMLDRALTNYYDLMRDLPLEESELMRKFGQLAR